MANEQLAELQQKQEMELVSYLESVENAKWNIFRDFKFAYGVDIEYHDLELNLIKLAQEQEK